MSSAVQARIFKDLLVKAGFVFADTPNVLCRPRRDRKVVRALLDTTTDTTNTTITIDTTAHALAELYETASRHARAGELDKYEDTYFLARVRRGSALASALPEPVFFELFAVLRAGRRAWRAAPRYPFDGHGALAAAIDGFDKLAGPRFDADGGLAFYLEFAGGLSADADGEEDEEGTEEGGGGGEGGGEMDLEDEVTGLRAPPTTTTAGNSNSSSSSSSNNQGGVCLRPGESEEDKAHVRWVLGMMKEGMENEERAEHLASRLDETIDLGGWGEGGEGGEGGEENVEGEEGEDDDDVDTMDVA